MAVPNRDQRVRNPQKPRFRALNGPVTPRLARDMANLGDHGPGPGPAGRGPVGPQIGPDGPKIRVWAISRATRGVFTRLKKFSPLKICLPDRSAMVPGPNSTVRDPAGALEVPGPGPGRPARPGGVGDHFRAETQKIS